MASYINKYFYIYLFKGISIVLGFVSMFIVMPFLTSNQELYGIYAICTSLTIYFSYADLGFGSAGQKFAVEKYVQQDREGEIRIVGFTSFIYITFMSLVSIMILGIAVHPDHFLKGITPDNVRIARVLLVVLACTAPAMALNRILEMIFSIRLEDYKYQRILICGNIVKIAIAFIFFGDGRYLIIPYYIAYHSITLVCCLIAVVYVKRIYNYDLRLLFKNIRFNRTIFDKVKYLAYASLVGMVCWILYYELDQLAIGAIWGVNEVAIYAIGISIITYFRTYLATLFSPLTTRFNYFVGQNDIKGLDAHILRVMDFFYPFVVIPILVVVFFAYPFVLSWVGPQYTDSVIHVRLLTLCNVFAFLTYPAGSYLVARQYNKYSAMTAILIAVVFWLGIFITKDIVGVLSFSSMKLVAFFISAILYAVFLLKIMRVTPIKMFGAIIKHYALPTILCAALSVGIVSFIPGLKDSSLLLNMLIMGLIAVVSFAVAIPLSPVLREKFSELYNSYRKK